MNPNSYRLHLEPDLNSFTFTGTATIRFSPSDTAPLALDAVDLAVQRCSLRDEAGPIEISWRLDDEKLILEPATRPTGVCEVEIDYTGAINDLMSGFYRSRYVVDGQTHYLATTQFEERDARRAFPCVDHPAAKAVFEIELLAPEGHIAIANTPVASTESQADGRTLFRFEPTPPMSTYLVYLAVGPFDVEVDTSWRIPIRVAVSPGKGPQARESLEYARKSITYLEELVGFEYPLGKLDSIGVADFAFGAMENFGAIAYRENLLLTDESSTTRAEVESMMGVAAHEIAHMWFGDLVSPAGWRYVWLNEAFATYFGNLTADH
ncbi:MAG TPA: M1 family metallopeptidase, partial [Spirochaetia bacterium]|nr:M1 family metallopeptidase [Spirochaetia bacterium]